MSAECPAPSAAVSGQENLPPGLSLSDGVTLLYGRPSLGTGVGAPHINRQHVPPLPADSCSRSS